MTTPPVAIPTPRTPYHRLARTTAWRWWRPLAIAVATLPSTIGLGLATTWITQQLPHHQLPLLGTHTELIMLLVGIGALLPLMLLAVRYIERRPIGTLSSVTNQLRWRWLLSCLPAAVMTGVLYMVSVLVIPVPHDAPTPAETGWVGLAPYITTLVTLTVVFTASSAAEEYMCRGVLLQAVGALTARPWLAILAQATVFAALHGIGTPWGSTDVLVYAIITGWLTVRTGGLEAALALHITINLLPLPLEAAFATSTADTNTTAADLPWQFAAVHLGTTALYALVIHRRARTQGLTSGTLAVPS
jgi:membrane protease YdiL (CAAX protease family)